MPADLIALDLPMSPAAPGLARKAVGGLALDRAALETVRLLASELVTNALIHSGAVTTGSIGIKAQVAGDTLRLSVTDGGTEVVPGARSGAGRWVGGPRERPGIHGGFGLLLVDELAVRWGVERGGTTTVWCEVVVRARAPVAD
jgi:anti-sigma regulatory factor (Ser/Thr protein kinase)